MKKIYNIILICLSLLLVSCNNNENPEDNSDRIFSIALPSEEKINSIYKPKTWIEYFLSLHTTGVFYEKYDDGINEKILLQMAKNYPQDITSQYVGSKWNINIGEIGRVWKIDLRDDLYWQNGEKIDAEYIINGIKLSKRIPSFIYNFYLYYDGKVGIEDLGIFSLGNSIVVVYGSQRDWAEVCDDFTYKINFPNLNLYNQFEISSENNNIYGTSLDNYLSYGPYKLIKLDETGVHLIRNANWFGYAISGDDYYQTEEIVVDYLEDYSTSYDLLVEGKYDYIHKDYLENVVISDKYIKRFKCNFPSGLLINSDYDLMYSIQEKINSKKEDGESRINKTIITIPEFKEALSLALDRTLTIQLMNKYSHCCLTNTIIPDNGYNLFKEEFIKKSDIYLKTLNEFYGVEYDKFNGNVELAKEKFAIAYNIALEKGLLKEDDIISLEIGTTYMSFPKEAVKEVLINQWNNVIKDTPLEGKIEFVESFVPVEAFQLGRVDIYYTSLPFRDDNPFYSYLNASISGSLYDFTNIYKNKNLKITFDKVIDEDGRVYNDISLLTSVYNWVEGFNNKKVEAYLISNNEITSDTIELMYCNNKDITNMIAAKCEVSILEEYNFIPLDEVCDDLIFSDNVVYLPLCPNETPINLKYLKYID